jgi:chromosomal replication initiation ATPase DnaA
MLFQSVKKHTHLENTAIGELFGGMHFSIVIKTSKRFQLKMDAEKHLQEKINSIMPRAKTL